MLKDLYKYISNKIFNCNFILKFIFFNDFKSEIIEENSYIPKNDSMYRLKDINNFKDNGPIYF
jgi:hypothetical protein